jgi:hypothetical protein
MYPPPFRKEWGRGRLARGFSQVQQLLSSSASGGVGGLCGRMWSGGTAAVVAVTCIESASL